MQVFKAYFKVVNKRKGSLLIFFFIFLLIAVSLTNALGTVNMQTFDQTKSNIAFYSQENTPLVNGLKEYLNHNAVIVNIPDNQQDIQDALYYGQISYILRIPQGFSQDFLNGQNVKLTKTSASGQTGGVYMDMMVNRYLNTAQLYIKNIPGITQEQIAASVAQNIESQASVDLNNYGKPADTNILSYYFRFLAYAIMAMMIMGVTTVMMAFSKADLQNRNMCAPVRQLYFNLQILLGNIAFALLVWAGLCALTFLLSGKAAADIGTLLLCLNALALTFVSLSIGFLAGKFIRSTGAQGAITNVISLGLCFLGGVFVSQDLLGSSVLTVASFTPPYWYVKAVNDIRNMVVFNADNVMPVVYAILIQFGFAAAILIVALVLSKQKKLANAYS
jgi:ABC-2 type transport system permease protein